MHHLQISRVRYKQRITSLKKTPEGAMSFIKKTEKTSVVLNDATSRGMKQEKVIGVENTSYGEERRW